MPPSPAPKSDGGFLPVRGRHRRGFGGPSASAAGALGAQRFRKRPFVPKAAPGPRRDPSPRGTRSSQVTTSAPRMWEAARTKRQTSRPGRPCPNTHTLGRGWNPPRQGAGGVPAPKADHPQGLRPSPREDAGRRGRVLGPPRRGEGCPPPHPATPAASQPPKCTNRTGGCPPQASPADHARTGTSERWVAGGSPLSPPREPALARSARSPGPGPQPLGWPKKHETGSDQASARTAAPRQRSTSSEVRAGAAGNGVLDPGRGGCSRTGAGP